MTQDLILALKDAYPYMTTERARALIDQIGPAAAQALLSLTTKASTATISYKGATMNKPIPQHMEAAYDYCDLIDEIASGGAVGRSWAKTFVSTAIAQAAKLYPKAAQKTLGDALVASYKADAKPIVTTKAPPMPADVIDAAIEELRAAATQAATRQGDKPIADVIRSLARQLVPEATGSGHVTDTNKTTKQAPKMIPLDQLLTGNAAGLGADARAIDALYAARLRGAK